VKSAATELNRVLESRVRLGIMAVLAVREAADFRALKALLAVTDGNLASHLATLEKHRYVRVRKEFVRRKPQTTYQLTEAGRRAFAEHIDALERLIHSRG
jgi:DNA-binding MarR family transcriptional regulator